MRRDSPSHMPRSIPLIGGRGRARRGNSHPRTMSSMYNLANLLQTMGQLEEAEQLFRKLLDKCGPACTARCELRCFYEVVSEFSSICGGRDKSRLSIVSRSYLLFSPFTAALFRSVCPRRPTREVHIQELGQVPEGPVLDFRVGLKAGSGHCITTDRMSMYPRSKV